MAAPELRLRINRQIRSAQVRVIGHDGASLGVLTLAQALQAADAAGLDLVEVAPNSQPPVCKVVDYGKYKYEEARKAKEAKKNQHATVWKEIRLEPAIAEHDLTTKINAARRFIDEGDRLRVTVRFRGRQMAHTDIGRSLLATVAKRLEDIASVTQHPLMEGRNMSMALAPGKAKIVRPATPAAPSAQAAANGAPMPSDTAPASVSSPVAPTPVSTPNLSPGVSPNA